jgi:hypothetical protein
VSLSSYAMSPSPRQISSFTNEKIVVGTTISFEMVVSLLDSKMRTLTASQTVQVEKRGMTADELLEVN